MPDDAPRFVAYYRVSTKKQERSGLGLEAQREIVSQFLQRESVADLLGEFTEAETGKGAKAFDQRPQLKAAVALCRKKKAVLLIATLDRLARNVFFISGLMEAKIEFRIATLPQATPFMINIYAAVAQEEGRRISERIKEALQSKKRRGEALGSRTIQEVSALGGSAFQKEAERFAANIYPIIKEIQAAGVTTLQGICDALSARGIRPQRGGEWYPTTVRNLLLRTQPKPEETR